MIHFVGAGSGAEDLITLRGARQLEEADVVIYAGSLVNPALLKRCKPGCDIHDSASMTLEEVLAVMDAAEAAGKTTVRLHTGDPSIYGAIREQMDALDQRGYAYDVTPGVSSFCGAAAALKAEYTLPGVSQTVIITRAEGRTPVPEGQKLRALAAHGATMVLFLSSSLLEKAQADLIAGGYSADTHTRSRVLQGHLARRAGLPLHRGHPGRDCQRTPHHQDGLITVGGFLGSAYDRSLLYDPGFSHGCREASR